MDIATLNGELNAAGKTFAVVAARWNALFTDRLIDGAIDAILLHGGRKEDVTLIRVPGSFEIPMACKEAALTRAFDAVIAVGTLIRGETDHYQLIASEVAAGLSRVMLETGVPATFGVITAHDEEQADARAESNAANKGFEAAVAAIELANVLVEVRKLRG